MFKRFNRVALVVTVILASAGLTSALGLAAEGAAVVVHHRPRSRAAGLVGLRNPREAHLIERTYGKRALWAYDPTTGHYVSTVNYSPGHKVLLYTSIAAARALRLIPTAPKPSPVPSGSDASASGVLSAPAGYSPSKLIFDDTFDGPTLDPTKWIPDIADQTGIWREDVSAPDSAIDPDSYDAEYFSPNAVKTGDGLQITATRSDKYPDYTWQSGCISTHGLFRFDGGYVQIRAKMPNSATGMWGGLWFLEGGAEIDLQESGYIGHGPVNDVVASNLHSPGNNQKLYNAGTNLSAGYHVYGMRYIPGQSVTTYLDGKQIAQFTGNVPSGAMTIVIDLQVAQNASGWHTLISAATPSPSTMDVSEVQVYQ